MKLRILRRGGYAGLHRLAQYNGLYQGKREAEEPVTKEAVMKGAEDQSQKNIKRCYAAGFEGGGRGHKPRKPGSLSALESVRKWGFL